MRLVSYVQENEDKKFLFLIGDVINDGEGDRFVLYGDMSFLFQGSDVFIECISTTDTKLSIIYEAWLGENVEPYYLDDSCLAFCLSGVQLVNFVLTNGEILGTRCICDVASAKFFEDNPPLCEYLKERVQGCTSAVYKVLKD